MARVSAAEKERSHARIVAEASQLLRAKGLEGASVSDVMTAAGLTHGGFYRHFKSKDDLAVAALEAAINDAMSDIEKAPTAQARAEALRRYVDLYLSPEHLRDRRNGCPLAALAVDAGRSEGAVKEAADRGVRHVVSLLSAAFADTTNNREDKAQALLSLLLGTITLARLATSADAAEQRLKAARVSASEMLSIWLQT